MFEPKYTITDQLLANIKHINTLVLQLNHRRFPQVVVVEFEREARIISSFASTSIEGNPLPLTEVKKLLKSQPLQLRDTEREVLNYNQALIYLDELIIKDHNITLSQKLILKIHSQVVAQLLPEHLIGKWRQDVVVVYKPATKDILFLPPDWQGVPQLIDDLIDFINRKQGVIDPLILAGLFHKQFVLIHPFMDGNGRTTRLVTKALLAGMGLNTFNLFSFENYYNQNVTRYMHMVGEYGDYNESTERGRLDFTRWLEYFTEGIIDELLRVEKALPLAATSPDEQIKPHHDIILTYLQTHKFITDLDYSNLTNRAKATRTQDFNYLIALGMIERKGKGRKTYYTFKS